MPTKYKDYPIYTYDEPAICSDFSGGINTDPSNEHLLDNELRDCVNMNLLSGALVKRKGAKEITKFNCEEDISNIQGIFLFSVNITYIILAANGKLYYSIYNENETINLKRLHILNSRTNRLVAEDCQDVFVGLSKNISNLIKHDGYYDYYDEDKEIKELIFQNHRSVQAASLNDKLYIATGTRIVEVYFDTNELHAHVIVPYVINSTEYVKIGENYLSPYPELCIDSNNNSVTTNSYNGFLKVERLIGGSYSLHPIMNFVAGENYEDYYYRWEKFIDGQWYTIITFKSQDVSIYNKTNPSEKLNDYHPYNITVKDADRFKYRCTFCKTFEKQTGIIQEFDKESSYTYGEYVLYNEVIYKCLLAHKPTDVVYPTNDFSTGVYLKRTVTENEQTIEVVDPNITSIWQEVNDVEVVPYYYETTSVDPDTGETIYTPHKTYEYDYKPNELTDLRTGQVSSVLYENNINVNKTFETIHSCNKVLADGNKLLFYGDTYNSGWWFKTIINNPSYISDKGCLSFKTNKNEEVINVTPFQGNLIIFANSEEIGGSIHIVSGNGDDYDDESGYYSPYQRKTINSSVSCNNANTIQVCDNILVFKYYNRVYYINSSDLNNDVVKVYPCNDRLLNKSNDVIIPWDDEDCISEVTENYYSLIWNEKYSINAEGDLVLEHPGLRLKFYYKTTHQLPDGTYISPWLRDESKYFTTTCMPIYIKGKSHFLYKNILISFNEDHYEDIDEEYEVVVKPKAIDANNPKLFKLISNVLIYYYRNQYSYIDFKLIVRNEAGHLLLNNETKKSIQDLKTFKAGNEYHDDERMKLDSTIQDTRVFTPSSMFPGLLFDYEVRAKNKGTFTLCSVTFNYTSIDSPDTNPYDLYTSIIRPNLFKK